jgi:hypothetical protein
VFGMFGTPASVFRGRDARGFGVPLISEPVFNRRGSGEKERCASSPTDCSTVASGGTASAGTVIESTSSRELALGTRIADVYSSSRLSSDALLFTS